jgi:RNA polymerase sigma factor (sigma-70 family)
VRRGSRRATPRNWRRVSLPAPATCSGMPVSWSAGISRWPMTWFRPHSRPRARHGASSGAWEKISAAAGCGRRWPISRSAASAARLRSGIGCRGLSAAWPRLLNSDQAVAYLRRMVINRCRSLLRRRSSAARGASRLPRRHSGAGQSGAIWPESSVFVAALRTLPPRQREALVLRYYGDLSESQAAAVMGISQGAVRTHTARALSALSAVLEAQDDDLVPLDTHHRTPADSGTPDWPDPDGHRYA